MTFAPAADIVREVAGSGAADEPEEIRAALAAQAAGLQHDEEDGRRLRAVLWTISGVQPGGDAGRAPETIAAIEVADAWARVVASVAAAGPVVLRLEDVHWADEVLLDVIERVADAMAGRAVLVVCTARPELLEHNPRWGAGRVNTTSIGLAPLSRQETAELLSDPPARPRISPSMREALLERAGGNPLYALEFVRMAGERMEQTLSGSMPETVQAVIAARLDGIPEGPRQLVQDAAVVGSEFWPGALAALSGTSEEAVRDHVADLVRRGLVRPTPDSAIEGQPQFAFGHALIREVAYTRLTRAQRAARHLAAARWMERTAGEPRRRSGPTGWPATSRRRRSWGWRAARLTSSRRRASPRSPGCSRRGTWPAGWTQGADSRCTSAPWTSPSPAPDEGARRSPSSP